MANQPLPPRSSDTMVDAIALTSPSGCMSKRARKAAEERLRQSLFGDGLEAPRGPTINEAERLQRHVKTLRELTDRGMSPRKFRKEADKVEQRINILQNQKG